MNVSTALTPISATHLNSSSSASAQLVLTFNDDILTGAGAITISDGATQTYIGKDGTLRTRLIGATDTRTIDITDTSKVSISGNTVTITLDSNLSAGKHYSVQMAQGVLLDENGNPFAGLADTSKLPFAVAAKPVPAAVIDSALAFQDDTGSSATDFITKTALQGVSGKFSGVLASGDFIEVSLDNGGTWLMATVDKDSWHVEASLTGSSTIVARVSNAEGGHSTAVRQAYTFDNQAPAVESITLSDADFVAGETAVVTLTFTETVTGLDLADFAVSGGVLSNLVNTGDGKTWTATLTPTINVANGVGQIALLADGVADVAGNSGPASAAQVSFTYSTVPNAPAAIVTSASMTDSGASSSDFITNATTQTITGQYAGTLAADEYIEVSLDGGTTYVRATASAGNWSIPSTTISASDTLKARVTNGYTYSNPLVEAYTLDQAAPTVGVTLADSTLALGETSLVTFTFNEAVANFSNQDITVSGGTLSPVSSADGGTTWTATFTPSTATLASTNAITVNKTGLTDLAGNAGAGNTSSANYVVDTVRPTVSGISVADTALTAGETTTVTFTFSEAVTGLSMADITVANGTLSALASSDGGLTWTATLTPASAVEDTSNLITLDHAGFADSAGNAGSGSTSSTNYTVDTKRPTATISMADATLTAGETTSVTITFSEAVTGLTSADFTLGNGTLSTPTTADNGVTWNATFTPSASVDATSNIIVLNNAGVADTVGNAGSGTTSSGNYIVATTRPSASAITVADTALKAGETATVTITFAEAVSGLTAADFSVANGTLSEPVSSDNGLTWTATLTPASAIEDTTNLITLDNTGVTDSDGNAGSGSTSSANYTVDTVRPLTSSISLADSTLSAGETTVVTFAFSEAVTGLTAAAVTVANGALSTPVSSDGGLTWTATLTPTASVDDSSNLLTLDNSAITDSAGNAGTGTTSSANYTVATVRPTATINVADDKLTAGETATVTITFSEAVSGLTSDDFTVGKGSLSTPTTSDNGVTWTATFTPPVNFDDEANVIVLDNTGVTDASGNTGSGTTSSNFHMLATRRPTVESLTVSDTALKVGDTATVTITFSEAVSGLTAADFSVANGTLSEPVSSNNGLTWTATLTPTDAIEDSTNTITLNHAGVTDNDGNVGSGSTSSANYTVDTVRPLTSSISLADSTLSAGETTTVTFTFSEAVTDLTAADVTVANGALSAPVSSDGGLTWTATLTPTASVEDSSNVITLDNTGIADAAGNAGSGTTSSANYTLDTKRPTATISVADAKLTAGETTTVTITFSEAVSGL
ncbi:MAG: Ig-like domain-containing protein, partial [Burkholderiaceae bacterium]|nr:Ig-like domain-containing protein [Burkholderiaceae bacterium]